MILDLLCVAVILFVLIGLYIRFSHAGRLMAKIPGPPRLPIFGHLAAMYKTPEQLFTHLRTWHESYGRLWRLDGWHLRAIHLYHPEDVALILSTTTYNAKDVPYPLLYGWLRDGLLVSSGDKWHQRRKMLTPAFHFNSLNKFFNVFCDHTQNLLDTIDKEVGKERTDLIPLISKAALLVMCETVAGTKFSNTSSLDKYLQSIRKIGECLVNRLTKPWYLVNCIYMFSPDAMRERSVLKDLHKFTKQIIQNRRKTRSINNNTTDIQNNTLYEHKHKPTLLDFLLDQEAKGTIDDDGITEEIDTFMFEGHDTVATALTFMIMRIANEPEIQESIYEELQDIYGDSQRSPTIGELNKMKYLECCIKESLRLYPSVPFISRFITKEVDIAGYRIPKNTICDIHVFDIHRDPEVYPEPEKFDPSRFLPQKAFERSPFSYIPFSAGPRNCIGQKFAIMELKILMSGVLRKYRLEPITKPEDLVFMADLVLRTNHPIYVRFRPRLEHHTS